MDINTNQPQQNNFQTNPGNTNNVQKPEVVYVEKKSSKKWVWVVVGILVFICACCAITCGVVAMQVNNITEKVSTRAMELDKKYQKYVSQPKFQDCLTKNKTNSNSNQNEIQEKITKKIKEDGSLDFNRIFDIALNEIIVEKEKLYANCAKEVDSNK